MSLQNFVIATDVPTSKLTIDTRDARARARDVGATIIESIRRSGRLARINAERKTAAVLLLYAMCYEHGEVEQMGEDVCALVVRKPLKEISLALGWLATSAYRPGRLLEDANIIERLDARGPTPDAYVICCAIPSPANQPEARAPCNSAAQGVWTSCEARQEGHTKQIPKCAPEHDLARASCKARQEGHSPQVVPEGCQSAFLSGEPATAQGARQEERARDSTVRTSTNTFTSTQGTRGEGRGDGGNLKEGEGDGWFSDWLMSLKGRGGEDMKPWVARKWARHPQITPEIQHAVRYEVEHSPARNKPNFSAAGLAVTFLKSPMTQLSGEAWEHAKRTLADDAHRERQFTGTRLADLFGEPAASPFATGPAEGQSIEDRATEIQQTLGRAELDKLHRQACDALPPGLQRMCVGKGDPRKLSQVHALIVRRLGGAAVESGAAR